MRSSDCGLIHARTANNVKGPSHMKYVLRIHKKINKLYWIFGGESYHYFVFMYLKISKSFFMAQNFILPYNWQIYWLWSVNCKSSKTSLTVTTDSEVIGQCIRILNSLSEDKERFTHNLLKLRAISMPRLWRSYQ